MLKHKIACGKTKSWYAAQTAAKSVDSRSLLISSGLSPRVVKTNGRRKSEVGLRGSTTARQLRDRQSLHSFLFILPKFSPTFNKPSEKQRNGSHTWPTSDAPMSK